jgi:hypothetical protein
MNKTIGTWLGLMLATAAAAHDNGDCVSSLAAKDLAPAIGSDIRIQPVYSPHGIQGWRIWGASSSAQLVALGIESGALLTHVCGVRASEIAAKNYQMCCGVDSSLEFEVIFRIGHEDRKVMIQRRTVP